MSTNISTTLAPDAASIAQEIKVGKELIAAARAKATANKIKLAPTKFRRAKLEVVRSYGSVKVERYLRNALPNAEHVTAMAEQLAKIAELNTMLESVPNDAKPFVQMAIDSATRLHDVMKETAAGRGTSLDEQKDMQRLACAAILSGFAKSTEVAQFLKLFVERLPSAGIER